MLFSSAQEIFYEFSAFPLRLQQLSFSGQTSGCTDCLTLVQICSGNLSLLADGQTHTLHMGQFALLDCFRFYRAESISCILLALRLDATDLRQQFPESFAKPFAPFCAPAQAEPLNAIFTQAAALAGQTQRLSRLALQRFALATLETVTASFGVSNTATDSAKLQRLAEELRHCAANFRQPLSPVDAAKRCYLSLPYFSKLFRQEVGLSYSECLTELRLNAAVAALESGKTPLHKIAEDCGFANARSFTAAYKARFGQLPSQHTHPKTPQNNRLPAPFLPLQPSGGSLPLLRLQPPAIDCAASGSPFSRRVFGTLPLGNAFELLLAARQQQLQHLMQCGSFSQGIVSGLLDVRLWAGGQAFALLDMAFDFVLALGLTPLLRLDNATATSPDYAQPDTASQIDQLLRHLAQRYGAQTVQEWQLAPAAFPERDFADLTTYFAGYRQLHRTAKNICLWQVASPAFLPDTLQENNPWFAGFMGQCREFSCLPDALNCGFFASDTNATLAAEALPNFLQRSMIAVRRMGLPYATLQIEEYALCAEVGDCLGDTPFHAAWLAKNLPECAAFLTHFAPAQLLDSASAQPFCGANGLLNASGVPKAALLALCMLGKLGNRHISHGDGYFITQTEAGLAVLLYNYCHPDTLSGAPTAPYTRFRRQTRRQFALTLCGLGHTAWQRTDLLLSQEHGSAYDAWLGMGGEALSPEDTAYLQAIAQPKRHRTTLQADAGQLALNETLAPFAVQLILLEQR